LASPSSDNYLCNLSLSFSGEWTHSALFPSLTTVILVENGNP